MSDAKSRAAAMRAAAQTTGKDEAEDLTAKPLPVGGKPVRQTVDITQRRHHQFAAKRMELALAMGENRLSVQQVLAALVDAFIFSPQVQRHVRDALERRIDADADPDLPNSR